MFFERETKAPAALEERTWTQQFELNSEKLASRLEEILSETNVHRITIRHTSGHALLEIPLTAGLAVGGIAAFRVPTLEAVKGLASALPRVKVDVERLCEDGDCWGTD